MTGPTTQVALERGALALLARPDVRAAIATSAERWRAGTPGLLPQTYDQLTASIEEVALLVALQVVDDDPRRPQVVEISAGPHIRDGLAVPGGRWGINNPDTLYFAVPVEAASTYRLRASPRGAPPTDINVSVQTPDVWGTLDSLGRRDLTFEVDGGFTVELGFDPHSGGNQLPLRPGGTVLMVRQTLADWTTELPYELSVERTGGPPPDPPASEDELARRIADRLAVVIEHSVHGLQPPILAPPANVVPPPGTTADKPGFLVAQRNALGHFRLRPDEALVLEIAPGGAGYAAVAATNVWGVTANSDRHQNSLNTAQLETGPDQPVTVVVANTDPGVDPWIDPGGIGEGIVMLRWQLLDDRPSAVGPGVTACTVALADLGVTLPGGVRRISPEERAGQLAERATAYGRRFDRR